MFVSPSRFDPSERRDNAKWRGRLSINLSIYYLNLGAIFLGDLAAAIFYGITCVQTFTYYQVFDRDHLALKLVVFFLWMLDTLQLAIVTYNVYNFAVLDWGDTQALDLPIWTFWAQMIVTTISDFVIRFIYGSRIWRLSNKNVGLAAAIAVSTLFVVGITFTLAIKSLLVRSNDYLYSHPYLLYLCLGSSAIADVIIASSLCVLLFKNRTHVRRTNSLLNTLMLYTICTGMLTGLYTAVLVVVYAALPLHAVFTALFSSFGKMYLNALLASLNARSKFREVSYNNTETIVFGTLRSPVTSYPSRKAYMDGDGTGTHTFEGLIIDIK